MTNQDILSKVDHTLLSTTARWPQIQAICDDALQYGTASVCIPPSFVAQVAAYMNRKKAECYPEKSSAELARTAPVVCTVIGFPNGYNTTAVKCFEASDAVRNGAVEVDMVINLGFLKEGKLCQLKDEINAIKQAAVSASIAATAEAGTDITGASPKEPILKVIVETCALTPQEIADVTRIVDASGADFIKTSTGFAEAGATFEDIRIFKENISGNTKIKAAGGISSLEDARQFLELGADRLGTSRVVKIIKQGEA